MPANPNRNPYGINYDALTGLMNQLQGMNNRQSSFGRASRQVDELNQRPGLTPGSRNTLDPSVELRLLQSGQVDDITRRLASPGAQYEDPGDLDALKKQLGLLEVDMESSPLTQQAKETDAYRGILQKANLQGFATPQEASAYSRQIAEEEMRQPMQRELEVSGRNMDTLRSQERIAQGNQEVQRDANRAYQSYLQGGAPGGAPVRSFTLPGRTGGGSMSFDTSGQRPPSGSLLNRLTQSRFGAEAARQQFGENSEQYAAAAAGYDQAVANVFNQFPTYSPDIKRFAGFVASDEELRNLSPEAILAHPKVQGRIEGSLDANELSQLETLLFYARGLGQ